MTFRSCWKDDVCVSRFWLIFGFLLKMVRKVGKRTSQEWYGLAKFTVFLLDQIMNLFLLVLKRKATTVDGVLCVLLWWWWFKRREVLSINKSHSGRGNSMKSCKGISFHSFMVSSLGPKKLIIICFYVFFEQSPSMCFVVFAHFYFVDDFNDLSRKNNNQLKLDLKQKSIKNPRQLLNRKLTQGEAKCFSSPTCVVDTEERSRRQWLR